MKKWTVVGLFWLVQVFTANIRVSLALVAPTSMSLYDITPQVMGYILSGWNWPFWWRQQWPWAVPSPMCFWSRVLSLFPLTSPIPWDNLLNLCFPD